MAGRIRSQLLPPTRCWSPRTVPKKRWVAYTAYVVPKRWYNVIIPPVDEIYNPRTSYLEQVSWHLRITSRAANALECTSASFVKIKLIYYPLARAFSARSAKHGARRCFVHPRLVVASTGQETPSLSGQKTSRGRAQADFRVQTLLHSKIDSISASTRYQTCMFSRKAAAALGTNDVWVGDKGRALTEPVLFTFFA